MDETDGKAGPVTRILRDDARTPASALEAVLPIVYLELRELAVRASRASSGISLQPTEVVHEAFIRLSADRSGWPDRNNLMVAAAVTMRRVLVDHVRRKRAARRGGGVAPLELDESLVMHDRRVDTLLLEEALRRLEVEDVEAAAVAELRVFGGLEVSECARALDLSVRTVERRWRFARAWLSSELAEDA